MGWLVTRGACDVLNARGQTMLAYQPPQEEVRSGRTDKASVFPVREVVCVRSKRPGDPPEAISGWGCDLLVIHLRS